MDVYIVYAILMHGIVLDNIDPNDFKYVYIGLTNQFEERMYHHLRCTMLTPSQKRALANKRRRITDKT